jgi:ureidoglycolate hydrolase
MTNRRFESMGDMVEHYLAQVPTEMLADVGKTADYLVELIELDTRDYMEERSRVINALPRANRTPDSSLPELLEKMDYTFTIEVHPHGDQSQVPIIQGMKYPYKFIHESEEDGE